MSKTKRYHINGFSWWGNVSRHYYLQAHLFKSKGTTNCFFIWNISSMLPMTWWHLPINPQIYLPSCMWLCVPFYGWNERNQKTCWQSIFYVPCLLWKNITCNMTMIWIYIYIYNLIYSWNYHPMNLKSFHCVMKVLLHMQRICWQVQKIAIKYECAFCYWNLHQMLWNFVWALIYFTRSGPCV
jgi:hypothetical protein